MKMMTFLLDTKTWRQLPDVYFLPLPRKIYLRACVHHSEKYGWLARLLEHSDGGETNGSEDSAAESIALGNESVNEVA